MELCSVPLATLNAEEKTCLRAGRNTCHQAVSLKTYLMASWNQEQSIGESDYL